MSNLPAFTCNLIELTARRVRIDAATTYFSTQASYRNSYSYRSADHEDGSPVNIQECFRILELSNDCNVVGLAELRTSFIRLAKLYHPDGKMPTSDGEKFARVENAYRTLRDKMLRDAGRPSTASTATRAGVDCTVDDDQSEKDHGIEHTAPQHRQYLSYEGVGAGTVGQRQRQYQSYRVDRAVDSVREHRTMKMASHDEQSLLFKDKKEARKHKIRSAIERLVEDLIQESMAKGDFDNLPGKGKPLKHTPHNPYIDSVTQKLNEVLINNGFTPEWITLEKEIREEVARLRSSLESMRSRLGPRPSPIGEADKSEFAKRANATLRQQVGELNRKIDKYNLVVPTLEKQRVHFLLDRETEKVLARKA